MVTFNDFSERINKANRLYSEVNPDYLSDEGKAYRSHLAWLAFQLDFCENFRDLLAIMDEAPEMFTDHRRACVLRWVEEESKQDGKGAERNV